MTDITGRTLHNHRAAAHRAFRVPYGIGSVFYFHFLAAVSACDRHPVRIYPVHIDSQLEPGTLPFAGLRHELRVLLEFSRHQRAHRLYLALPK